MTHDLLTKMIRRHPQSARGKVSCRVCSRVIELVPNGSKTRVWPLCCDYPMTSDLRSFFNAKDCEKK